MRGQPPMYGYKVKGTYGTEAPEVYKSTSRILRLGLTLHPFFSLSLSHSLSLSITLLIASTHSFHPLYTSLPHHPDPTMIPLNPVREKNNIPGPA